MPGPGTGGELGPGSPSLPSAHLKLHLHAHKFTCSQQPCYLGCHVQPHRPKDTAPEETAPRHHFLSAEPSSRVNWHTSCGPCTRWGASASPTRLVLVSVFHWLGSSPDSRAGSFPSISLGTQPTAWIYWVLAFTQHATSEPGTSGESLPLCPDTLSCVVDSNPTRLFRGLTQILFVRTQNGVGQDRGCRVHRGSLTDRCPPDRTARGRAFLKERNEVSENRTMTAEVCDVGQARRTTLPPSSCYCCCH